MGNKLKKFFMNSWTVTIGGGLILSVIISVINDFVKKDQVFSTINTILSAICKVLLGILNYKIKVWWLLVGIIILILIIFIFVKYLDHNHRISIEPEFLEYTQDIILGYKWKWNWQKDIYGKYCIEGLCPICSQCGTPLIEELRGYGIHYKCLRCNREYYENMPNFDHVKIMITDNVRRKYFPGE